MVPSPRHDVAGFPSDRPRLCTETGRFRRYLDEQAKPFVADVDDMNHADHVRLIAPAVPVNRGGIWADFGAGTGAFTLALRDLAGPEVEIYAVDHDQRALQALRTAMDKAFPGTALHLLTADFTDSLHLSQLDGIVIANALHYVRDHLAFLRSLPPVLAVTGRVIVVEYDTDRGNRWVPYPLSARTLPTILTQAGFRSPTIVGRVPSRFLGSIYAASALAPSHNTL